MKCLLHNNPISLSNEKFIQHLLTRQLHPTNKDHSTITKLQSKEHNSRDPTSSPTTFNLGKLWIKIQTLTRIDKVVIGDYYNIDNNEWNHKLVETSTSIVKVIWKPYMPFLCIYLPFNFFNKFLQMYTLEKNITFPLRILCMPMPQITPLSTPTLEVYQVEGNLNSDEVIATKMKVKAKALKVRQRRQRWWRSRRPRWRWKAKAKKVVRCGKGYKGGQGQKQSYVSKKHWPPHYENTIHSQSKCQNPRCTLQTSKKNKGRKTLTYMLNFNFETLIPFIAITITPPPSPTHLHTQSPCIQIYLY